MNFKELIDKIRIRPGMYVGKYDLNCLELFAGGFSFCLQANGIDMEFTDVYRKFFNFFVQSRVLEKVNEELKKELRFNNGMRYIQLIPFAESDTKNNLIFTLNALMNLKNYMMRITILNQ